MTYSRTRLTNYGRNGTCRRLKICLSASFQIGKCRATPRRWQCCLFSCRRLERRGLRHGGRGLVLALPGMTAYNWVSCPWLVAGADSTPCATASTSRRSPAGHARGRRHVGRRRFLGHGGAAQGRGLRRRRRHAAALRPWRGDPSQGRLLRRPGHPRRARGRRAHRHSALRARLREPLQGGGDRPLRRELRGRRDAGALRRVQPVDQVPRPARRPRASSAPRCWRPATTSPPGALPGGGRALYRARESRARPELFPVRHHARAARSAALSARRHDQGARRASWRAASASRSPTSTTARTSASCRPAATPR